MEAYDLYPELMSVLDVCCMQLLVGHAEERISGAISEQGIITQLSLTQHSIPGGCHNQISTGVDVQVRISRYNQVVVLAPFSGLSGSKPGFQQHRRLV